MCLIKPIKILKIKSFGPMLYNGGVFFHVILYISRKRFKIDKSHAITICLMSKKSRTSVLENEQVALWIWRKH